MKTNILAYLIALGGIALIVLGFWGLYNRITERVAERVRKTGEKGDLQISVLVNRTLVTAEISAFRNASKRICLRGGGQRLSSRGTSSKPVVLSLTPTGTRSAGVVGSARRKGGSGNRGSPVMCEGSGLKAAVVRALRPGNAGGGKDPDF